MKKLNFLATLQNNYIFFVFRGLIQLVSIPVFLRLTGSIEWGLISIFLTLQSAILMIDLGMTQILPREFSGVGVDNSTGGESRLLLTVEKLYVVIGLFAFIVLEFIITPIFLDGSKLTDSQISTMRISLLFLGIQVFFQLFIGVYVSYLLGTGNHSVSNRIQLFSALIKLLLMTVFLKILPSVVTFSLVNLFLTIVEAYLLFKFSWSILGGWKYSGICANDCFSLLKKTYHMNGLVLVGWLQGQIDKWFLVKVVNIEIFGIYTAIYQLAYASLQLYYPLSRSILPYFSQAFIKLKKLDKDFYKIIIFAFIVSVFIFIFEYIFSYIILSKWLGISNIKREYIEVYKFLCFGVMFASIYNICNPILIAAKKIKKIFIANTLSALSLIIYYGSLILSQDLNITLVAKSIFIATMFITTIAIYESYKSCRDLF